MAPLKPEWKELFQRFIKYFELEMKAVNDNTLDKELKQLVSILQVGESKVWDAL